MPLSKDRYKKKEFFKIGNGCIGGKAEGLQRLSALVSGNPDLRSEFSSVELTIPATIVLATDAFDDFLMLNRLKNTSFENLSDKEIAAKFLNGTLPPWVISELQTLLTDISCPIAVRSSSLLEDARFSAYAGLYRTYILPNNHPDRQKRTDHLIQAIKLIYASTYFQAPCAFAARVGHYCNKEKMAVVIQHVVGSRYGNYYYPALSGVAQSYNYYPFKPMKPEDGVAVIAMGLGNIVVEGEKALRFCPRYPHIMPQRASVEDLLKNSQRHFYCIDMEQAYRPLTINEDSLLTRREITDAESDPPMHLLASTFVQEENRIRDTFQCRGCKVLTFANILKFKCFPLARILSEILKLCRKDMAGSVEIEFSVNIYPESSEKKSQFALLQLRPMSAKVEQRKVQISESEQAKAFCRSTQALGNAVKKDMHDIVYVRPDTFDTERTLKVAREIRQFNAELAKKGRRYILIGPGRWGSKDRWLGIPVAWQDISEVGAIVESYSPRLRSEPSQGSHFFHNISTTGINYITVGKRTGDYMDWDWIMSQPVVRVGLYVNQITFPRPITLKVDGRTLQCVIYV